MKDRQGHEYSNLNDLKKDQTVWLDGGFTCHRPGPVTIKMIDNVPTFECKHGHHFLDGQCEVSDDNKEGAVIGVYSSDPGPIHWDMQDYFNDPVDF